MISQHSGLSQNNGKLSSLANTNDSNKPNTTSGLIGDSQAPQQQFNETQNSFFMPSASVASSNGSQNLYAQGKIISPPNVQTDGNITRIYEGETGVFTLNQPVIATSGEAQRIAANGPINQNVQQRSSKQRKQFPGDPKSNHQRVVSNPSKQSDPIQQMHMYTQPLVQNIQQTVQQNPTSLQDQYQAYNLFHPTQMGSQPFAQFSQTQQQSLMQQAPQQVHFIAKQQKFYQISPSRGAEVAALQVGQVPILFDKRPYTSSSIQQVMNKRSSGNKVQNQAIAALYLANAKQNNPNASNTQNSFKANQTDLFSSQTSQIQSQTTPYQPPKKRMIQNLSVPRKNHSNQNQVFTQLDHEQLFEEAIRLKQLNYDLRDENGRLKARIKMQETEILRKDKAIEDFYQQNQFIQNAQKTAAGIGAQLAPIAATTQKYQQETFLLMSLKKQVKQLKADLQKRDEQLSSILKHHKISNNVYELENNLELYKEEVQRLQTILSMQQQQNQFQTETDINVNSSTQLRMNKESTQMVVLSGENGTELSASESNQAHVIAPGVSGSTDELLQKQDSHFSELLQQKEAQISELQSQLQAFTQKTTNQTKDQQIQQLNESLKSEVTKLKKSVKEINEKLVEKEKLVKNLQQKESQTEAKQKEVDNQIKQLQQKANLLKDTIKLKDDKITEKDNTIAQLEKKKKSLKETIAKMSKESTNVTAVKQPIKNELTTKPEITKEASDEIKLIAPILGSNQKITDRLTLASELKQGLSMYQPSSEVALFLKESQIHEIAYQMPNLSLPKARLDEFTGELGENVKCDFSDQCFKVQGLAPSLQQRQYLMARYLSQIQGKDVYINTINVQEDLNSEANGHSSKSRPSRKKSIDEEQMLDIAEMCFVRIADVLIKQGLTVREAFGKYAIPEMLPESKTVLELLIPEAFFEALRAELKMKEFPDVEAACLMRVLAKPELDNAIILNEFALIMENFGVPLIDGTISDEEDYIPEGQDKPRAYDLKNIDEDGIEILQNVAKYLLKEYQHPREFFGKVVKNNVEIKNEKHTFRVDTLAIKDFYLKIKIANIRKTLTENQSLNRELCLDPVAHPTVFNMKTFVRALEDIAEVEQERMLEIEKAQEQKLSDINKQTTSNGDRNTEKTDKPQPVTLSSALNPFPDEKNTSKSPTKQPPSDYNESAIRQNNHPDVKSEAVRFVKGSSRSRRSPKPTSKFQALGTIDEAVNETATSQQQELSMKDDESKLGSNNLRSSNQIDFEESGGSIGHHKDSMQRVDLLNRSLSGRGNTNANSNSLRNPELVKSIRSDKLGQRSSSNNLPADEAYESSAKSQKSQNFDQNATSEVFEEQPHDDEEKDYEHEDDNAHENEQQNVEEEDYEDQFQ